MVSDTIIFCQARCGSQVALCCVDRSGWTPIFFFANRGFFILFVAVFTGVERCDHVTFKDTDTAKTVSPVWLNRGLDRSNLMRSDLSVFNVLAATRYTAETDWLNQGEGRVFNLAAA